MAKTAKARHMPDLSVRLFEVVCIQLASIELATTSSAAIVVLAKTANPHYFTLEYRVWIQTLTCPFSAARALCQSSRHAISSYPSQTKLFIRSCVATALGQVAKHVSAGPVPFLDVCS
jgi:hypothetical protein